MDSPGVLFNGSLLDDALRGHEAAARKEAEALSDRAISAETVDTLVDRLVAKFRIAPLEVDWQHKTAALDDQPIEVQGWNGDAAEISGTRLTFRVPFAGEADLFNLCPSQFTAHPPRGDVQHGELVLRAAAPASERENLKVQLEAEIGNVQFWVEHANADVAPFNERLPTIVREAVERRRAKVLADQEFLASLGVPVDDSTEPVATYAVSLALPEAPPHTPSGGRRPTPAEPVLAARDYEVILDTCRGQGHSMERTPDAYAGLDEEHLRDHFLASLNSRYQGRATGETFNKLGKTDILVRRDDHNLFVGECKNWDGPATLTEALNQILDYTTWRDTRTAILVFNRDRAMTTVLKAIVPTVMEFQGDAHEVQHGREGEFRFELHQRTDPERKLILTVQVFDLSPKK
jgi:hypothetical protein